MLNQIKGLHHVTSFAGPAQPNNAFFTRTLGLRRVKKTVNFDAPDVYHLYYADGVGTPGSVMTYFPFPHSARGKPGVGEVSTTSFSVPTGSLPGWETRLGGQGVKGMSRDVRFGQNRLLFDGTDGDSFALIETNRDNPDRWTGNGVGEAMAITGFHSAAIRLADADATADLLQFMGYEQVEKQDNVTRFRVANGNGADLVDIEAMPGAKAAQQGAGSVHHLAFAVENRAAQLAVRKALTDAGAAVTPVIDRNYFWSIYFRTPGGVLFEVATDEPGFDHDEDTAHLGQALMLPAQHEHLRSQLEHTLEPLAD